MYNNIGKKIKAVAKAVCILGIIASMIAGLGYGILEGRSMAEIALIPLAAIIVGSLVSWVSSFMLYGFGELVDKTSEIADSLRKPRE
ncbi:MAG: hypothetical protein PHI83_03010 [Sphaerochaetaceae bacterium]|jgi:hypothetical protein|nr:hypothetical protein [Sphaerochaetaceae bacterium]